VQQRLIRLESVADFDDIVAGVLDRGPPRDWESWLLTESAIRVPSGPIEHW
jgi:hypothetical protein